MFKKRKYSIVYWIFRGLFLLGYLAAMSVLIVEATIPGPESAKRSEAVGEVVGGIINDMNGDQAKEVLPTKAIIQNKQTDYKVGEETTIDIKTEPEDATYRSYAYSSDNVEIASVDETGLVNFLKEGNATITAINTKVPEVFDTITFNVSNIAVESMESSINATLKDGVYNLEIYKKYIISNVIKPNTATDKTVTYEYTNNPYFELTDDTIKVNADSNGEVFDIRVTCGDITNILKVMTYAPAPIVEDYPITGLKASNTTKYSDQTTAFTPSISYVPTYTSAKYKGYTLTSDNESIVVVQSNKTSLKPTGTVGSANITATSTYDPSISVSFKVTVQARPAMTSIKLGSYSSVMYVGASQTVSVTVTPSTAKVTKTYTSSNTNAITVTNAGRLTAKALGSSTITAKVTDSFNNVLTKSFTVEVKEKPLNCASDFTINYKQGETPIVYADEEFNLDNYFGIKSFEGNSEPLNVNNYDFSFDVTSDVGEYNAHKFTPHKVGEVKGLITFTNEDSSVIAKNISFYVIDRFSITYEEVEVSNLDLDIYGTYVLTINDNGKSGQSYKISLENNTAVYSYASKSITLTTKEAGTGTLIVTPMITSLLASDIAIDESIFEPYQKKVTYTVSDVLTSKMDVTITHKNGDLVNEEDGVILLYMNDTLNVSYALDEKTTKAKVNMTLSNANATLRNGLITPKKIGNTRLTITESITGIVKEYDIAIRHKVGLKEGGSFLLSGLAQYDIDTNTITILNGDNCKIAVNFTNDSTYRRVSYEVNNTAICLIGNDGTITPLKAGATSIKVTVKDDNYTYIEFDININVEKRPFITDMGDFFRKVRKAVGHFGAFAVLGFLGAFTWFLWLRGKIKFPIGVLANFGIGFGLSWLTEYIQAYVPHRTSTWSDIWLDFSGFAIVAGAATILIIAWWLIRLLIRTIKNKKTEQKEEINK